MGMALFLFKWTLQTMGFETGAMGGGVKCSDLSTDRRLQGN